MGCYGGDRSESVFGRVYIDRLVAGHPLPAIKYTIRFKSIFRVIFERILSRNTFISIQVKIRRVKNRSSEIFFKFKGQILAFSSI